MVGSGPDPAKYSAPDRPGSASLWKRKGVFFSFSIKGGQINLDFEALGYFPFVGFLFQKLSGLFLLMLSEIGYLPVPPVSVSTLNIILWRFRVIKTSPTYRHSFLYNISLSKDSLWKIEEFSQLSVQYPVHIIIVDLDSWSLYTVETRILDFLLI